MTQHPFQLIIFDCDGVLVDSEPIANTVFVDCLREHGIPLTYEEAIEKFVGRNLQQCIDYTEKQYAQKLPQDFIPYLRKKTEEAFTNQLQPVEGIPKLLHKLTIPFCVASSGPQEKIRHSLTTTGLLPHFPDENIFSCYDIDSWKPDPEIFLHAASKMGVSPENCAVVEDSDPGVQAGIAAGMHVFSYQPAKNKLESMRKEITPFPHMETLSQLFVPSTVKKR